MSWIRVIPYSQAAGRLKALYDRVNSATGDIDNIIQVHSLRPHSMEWHLALYNMSFTIPATRSQSGSWSAWVFT